MIKLREMMENDIPFIISCLDGTSEDFMLQWGGGRIYRYPVTIGQMTAHFNLKNDSVIYFMITENDKTIGSVELDYNDKTHGNCAVCRFLIAPEYRSRGYGTLALDLLTEYAFNVICASRLYLTVFDFNTSAIKCYEKAGFSVCGKVPRVHNWIALVMEKRNPRLANDKLNLQFEPRLPLEKEKW